MTRVLFVCTHNSARSQMAEGFLRARDGARFEAASAGTEKTSVNPLAIEAMAERGIDISAHTSKMCDEANERCPFVPGMRNRLHWSFPDPSRATGTHAERLAVFRRVRDQIEARLSEWLESVRA